MARNNSNLVLATIACLSQRALAAAIASGALSKSDVAVVNGLRAGRRALGHQVAHRKLVGAIRKQFVERAEHDDRVRKAIKAYARDAVKKETEMAMSRVVADRVEKARAEQQLYGDLIKAYAREHPGATKADCIDKILFGAGAKRLVELDREIDALAKAKNMNTLPQPGATSNINFNTPVHGRTGYDSSVADTHPRNQAVGENPIIRDHHQLLDDIASGKVLWNDPKVSALVALERKRIFEND
jgi:hypothetical protein